MTVINIDTRVFSRFLVFLLDIFNVRQYAVELHKVPCGRGEVAKIYASDDINRIACCCRSFAQAVSVLFGFPYYRICGRLSSGLLLLLWLIAALWGWWVTRSRSLTTCHVWASSPSVAHDDFTHLLSLIQLLLLVYGV